MKTYLITYWNGCTVAVDGYNILMALGKVGDQDFIKSIEQLPV